jgi:hypothetical protein
MMMATKNVDQQLGGRDMNQAEIAIQKLCTSN